jgi:hypothetical protein
MTITKTTRQKLKRNYRHTEATLSIYREAEAYVNQIVFAEWPNIALRQTDNERNNYVEHLIYSTRKNKAVYADFDRTFYKFPTSEASDNQQSNRPCPLSYDSQWEGRQGQERHRTHLSSPMQWLSCSIQGQHVSVVRQWESEGKLFNGKEWLWYHLPFEPINLEKRFPSEE